MVKFIRYELLIGLLIVGTVLAFVWQLKIGLNPDQLVQEGGMIGSKFYEGEYWRVLSPILLHGSWFHLGSNMLSLFFLGRLAVAYYGNVRFLIIYLASGIAGNMLALYWTPNVVLVGASGAIFGLMGALVIYGIFFKSEVGPGFLGSLGSMILLNLYNTFANPGISIGAHIGGLVTGIILGFLYALIGKLVHSTLKQDQYNMRM